MPEIRPIDADALYSKLHSIGGCDAKDEWAKGYDDGVSAAIDCLQDAPPLDVVPVVHAHWIQRRNGKYYCDNCGREERFIFQKNYCPKCGARMDGKDGEQDATD